MPEKQKTQEDYYQEFITAINTTEQYIQFVRQCIDSNVFYYNPEKNLAAKEFVGNWHDYFLPQD